MKWIHTYQLFMFDFDGLLVNTEEIHFLAYKQMCAKYGFNLTWSFSRYCQSAHYDADRLKNDIYREFPELQQLEPNWNILYGEKKKNMINLLKSGAVHLMPGVKELLLALQQANLPRCVVTHSPDEQVSIIRRQNPALDTISTWLTRESYTHPKPHPECYLNAIEQLGKSAERIIGFEDTPRGLRALMQTRAIPVLISQVPYSEIPELVRQGARYFPSFTSIG
ncbi:MAG TPA: HAD family phosphatase [Waddliaceae bacterium]